MKSKLFVKTTIANNSKYELANIAFMYASE